MYMSAVWDDAPDESLLATARAEPAAFGAFYRRHEDQVLGYFLARVGDPEVAADLTAEEPAKWLKVLQDEIELAIRWNGGWEVELSSHDQ